MWHRWRVRVPHLEKRVRLFTVGANWIPSTYRSVPVKSNYETKQGPHSSNYVNTLQFAARKEHFLFIYILILLAPPTLKQTAFPNKVLRLEWQI